MKRTFPYLLALGVGIALGYFASAARPARYTAFCPVPPLFPNKPKSQGPYDMSEYLRSMGFDFIGEKEAIIIPKGRDFIVLPNVTAKEIKELDLYFIPSVAVKHE